KQERGLLVVALRERVREAFVPPAAPGIRRPATQGEAEGVGPAMSVLGGVLDEGKGPAGVEARGGGGGVGEGPAVRRALRGEGGDMRGEGRPLVSGRELLSLGAAPEWCADGEGRELLAVLRGVLADEPDVPALLADQTRLDGWVSSVFSGRDAGNRRRWWGR